MAYKRVLLALAWLPVVVGCAAETATEDTGVASTSVIRGTESPVRSFTGVVRLTHPDGTGTCSGVMVTNNFVLTAKHCFQNERTVIEAYIDSPQTTTTVAQRFDHPTLDVAVFRLASPFPSQVLFQDPTFTGYRRAIYAGATEDLKSQNLFCWGYGISAADYQTRSDGRLRSAMLPVKGDETGGSQVVLLPNKTNPLAGGTQRLWSGDSGGPCFTWDGNLASIDHGHVDFFGLPDPLERTYQTSAAWVAGWVWSIATY